MRTLDSFPKLLPWLERSPTFKRLYESGLRLGITIGDSLKYKWSAGEDCEEHFQEEASIYMPNIYYWDTRITANHIAPLAHELRHAEQDPDMLGLDSERDAYYYQGMVVEELKQAGYKVAKSWHPLSEADIVEAYTDYYAGT